MVKEGPSHIAFVSNQLSGDLSTMSLDGSTGQIREEARFNIGGNIMPMAMTPDRRNLFVVRRSEPTAIVCFEVSAEGVLTDRTEVRSISGYVHISTDPSGRYLLGVSHKDHFIALHPITKGVVEPPLVVRAAGQYPHGTAFAPTNTCVLVTSLGNDRLLAYDFDVDTGRLEPRSEDDIMFNAGLEPRHVKISASGASVFVNGERSGALERIRLENIGALHRLNAIDIRAPQRKAALASTADIALSLDERYIYVSERAANHIVCVRGHTKNKLSGFSGL